MRDRETAPIPFDPSDEAGPPRRWRRRLRRVARWALYGVGSLTALVVLALAFLQTRWGNELVRARVEHVLAGKLDGGSVSLGSVDHSFLFGEIELGDLTIRDRTGAEAIALGSLHATVDRSSLLAREAVLGELSIRDLAVSIVKKADGTSNLTGLFKKSKGSSLKRIAVGSLSVAGARATIDKPDGTRIAVDRLAVTGSVEAVPGDHAVELALTRLGGQVTIAKPDAEPRALAVGIGTVALARRGDITDVSVRDVMAGPLAVSSLAMHAQLVDGKASGQQSVVLSGLTVDSTELGRLIGKKLLASDVAIDARMAGPPEDLRITGAVATGGGTLALTGNLALGERPRYQMSLVGSDIDSSRLLVAARLPVESSLKMDVHGEGRTMSDMVGHLSASVGPSRAGKLAIDGVELEASWDRGAISLEKLAARAPGVEITAGGALGADKLIDGSLRVRGNPAEAAAALGLALPIRALPQRLDVTVSARGALRGDVAVALAPTRIALAGGSIAISGAATLSDKKLAGASAHVRLADLDLAALARLAGRPPKLTGSLGGSIDLTRTGPRTDVALDLSALLDQPAVALRVRGAADPTSAVALKLDATRRRDGALLASADARLPIATRAGKRTLARSGDWHLVLDVGERSLAEIAELMPERLRAKIPPGAIAAHVDIGGTPAQPSGSAHIDLTGAFLKGKPLRQEVRLDAAISSRGAGLEIATDGSIKIDGRQDPTALVRGGVSLPALDRAALRRAALDLSIEIPERELASFASLRPALARLPGRIGGGVIVKGSLPAPQIDSRLAWTGYRTADGGRGETALVIRGTPRDLFATATVKGGLSIAADIHRGDAGAIAIQTRARADGVPLDRILPEFAARRLEQPGRLRWHMDGDFALARQAGKLAAVKKSLTGTLEVDGAALAIPGTDRRWERIGLDLEAGADGLTIHSLSLHERDVEVEDRHIDLSGTVAWNQMKPTRVALDLRGRDWLLFGTPLLGKSDAPRAAADLDVGLAIDLSAPIMKVDATVRRLSLRSPDRLDRGHQPEDIAPSGDVIFTGGKKVAGKLPVPPAPPAAAGPARHRRPMDIRVRIPHLVRLNQTPFDLRAKGEIRIAVRDQGTVVRGGLTIPKGSLFLFGKYHRLASGKLTFSDEHPKGWIELDFRRKLSPADSRALAGMDEMQVTFAGPPTAPKPKLGGAGNAALAEAMAMNASGHPLHLTEPDMPASATVQAPRGDQLSMLTFMASNMPHLLFLDRFAAWADPYDGRASYGRVERFEGERTSKSGKTRVRVVTRPPTPGRSSAEIQWDRLLMDRRRAAFGVGVRGGSRAGGGVGFFFEWSSDD